MSTSQFLFALIAGVLTSCSVSQLASCVQTLPIPEIALEPQSVEVDAGGRVELRGSVTNAPAKGSKVKPHWEVSSGGGELAPVSDEWALIRDYIAPKIAGTYYVTFTLRGPDGASLGKQAQTKVFVKALQGKTGGGEILASEYPIQPKYAPNAHMGDAQEAGNKAVLINPALYDSALNKRVTEFKVTFKDLHWIAVAWTTPAESKGNFGQQKGLDLSAGAYTKVTFRARGAAGGESLTFKAGGHTQQGYPYQNTLQPEYEKRVVLTKNWETHTVEWGAGKNLANVPVAFVVAAAEADQPGVSNKLTFFLDNIVYTK